MLFFFFRSYLDWPLRKKCRIVSSCKGKTRFLSRPDLDIGVIIIPTHILSCKTNVLYVVTPGSFWIPSKTEWWPSTMDEPWRRPCEKCRECMDPQPREKKKKEMEEMDKLIGSDVVYVNRERLKYHLVIIYLCVCQQPNSHLECCWCNLHIGGVMVRYVVHTHTPVEWSSTTWLAIRREPLVLCMPTAS